MFDGVDFKALDFWFDVVQTLGLLVVSVYIWITNKHKANSNAIDKVESEIKEDIDNIEDTLIGINKDIEHLPNDDDLIKIHQRIDEVAQGLKRVEGSQDQALKTLELIQRHLISKG